MERKLTVRVDEKLIQQAKAWASKENVSLSQAISQFFAAVTARDKLTMGLSPWMETFQQMVKPPLGKDVVSWTDAEVEENYRTYLEEKYR
ncbi:DUF6364 family protein [Gloeobacter violaceus]|uniref:Gsl2301 protein n=1 Tax=Gloeobacter violaceus (strain ATCC 29082 / PCC 7421) TaxID=251221 RepID=Q7NI82_GLOVI|nr:DUF6364 family protein [Gloeobacter violaceus]BAC90242.1 gsl2301 [Gloeobacter violaceus PCC 7421]